MQFPVWQWLVQRDRPLKCGGLWRLLLFAVAAAGAAADSVGFAVGAVLVATAVELLRTLVGEVTPHAQHWLGCGWSEKSLGMRCQSAHPWRCLSPANDPVVDAR